ncbi:MAG: prepilin-type N-terminal cleavage/methylation domain-containing protein [Candidatus Methylomirabilales bacterium]
MMRDNRGFSAIEVLIAATIIVVALLAIASMAPTAYRTVDWSGEDTMAVTLAQQRIEFQKNQPFPAADSTTNEPAWNPVPTGNVTGYTRQTVIDVDPAAYAPLTGIAQVTVTVTSVSGRQVVLTTLIAQ